MCIHSQDTTRQIIFKDLPGKCTFLLFIKLSAEIILCKILMWRDFIKKYWLNFRWWVSDEFRQMQHLNWYVYNCFGHSKNDILFLYEKLIMNYFKETFYMSLCRNVINNERLINKHRLNVQTKIVLCSDKEKSRNGRRHDDSRKLLQVLKNSLMVRENQ